MLVVSRGRNDKVVFPTLGISVEILRIEGNNVRIGVDAPREIPVLRDELMAKSDYVPPSTNSTATNALSHAVRNRLQTATLGLRILQRMLDAGQAADAEPTIFKIFNELKSLEAELDPAAAAPVVAPNAPTLRHALVVEDDPNENELLAGYLRLSGFEVSTALDGWQAMVQLAQHDRPDVVLLDMKMPRFDGGKTVSAIRQHPDYQSLKIFAVTGTDQAETAVSVGPRGVNRWFRKPIDPERLVAAIHQELAAEVVSA